MSTDNLKLIYILKVGKNSKKEGVYEFIFSNNIENIDVEMWNWDQSPAIEHKQHTIPDKENVDMVYSLITKDFVLACLCDAVDRPYIHGYHLIQALAYEDEDPIDDEDDADFEYDDMYGDNDEQPLLVFHYGMTLKDVEDRFYERSIIIQGDQFVNPNAVKR